MIEFVEGIFLGAIITNGIWLVMVVWFMRDKTFKARE
jgi:hypothetical protein